MHFSIYIYIIKSEHYGFSYYLSNKGDKCMGEVIYIQIKQEDGYKTKVTHYICPDKPKASILILHGMAEHQNRYQHFAKYLISAGYDVFCYDHRGHGKDKLIKELGYFASDNGHELVIQDAITVSKYIEENNRCNKFILLGHSMGSIIARNVIQSYDHYNGVILSGTTYPTNFMLHFGLTLANLTKRLKGPKKLSPFLNNLFFGNKFYTSLSKRTVYDWLTRSNPIVGAYINDPYCGFVCTTSFYYDLLTLTYNASNVKLITNTKKDLPFYIISGDHDPVSSYGKEIKKYLNVLNELGFNNISSKLYPNCRHEILNELNREEVYSDITNWISKRL